MNVRPEHRAAEAIEAAVRSASDELDLDGLGLRELPDLPPELGHLRRLRLSGNRLQSLPPGLWRLTQLERLDLGSNRLRHLDPSIGGLARLESLDVSENRISALPTELASCTRLTHLDLFDNLLTTVTPEVLALPIVSLDLSRNHFEVLPDFIDGSSRLQALDLSGNRLERVTASLGRLASLKVLNLSANRLTSIEAIVSLLALEELFLDDNELRQLPEGLASLPHLRVVSTKGNPLEAAPEWLNRLKAPNRAQQEAGMLRERLSGGYEPGAQYFDAPLRSFEFSLVLENAAAVSQSLDLYFKQFAGAPVSLVWQDGKTVDLTRLGRKGALRIAASREPSRSPLAEMVSTLDGSIDPRVGGAAANVTLVFRPTNKPADVELACGFAERAIDRVAGIELAPRTLDVEAVSGAEPEPPADVEAEPRESAAAPDRAAEPSLEFPPALPKDAAPATASSPDAAPVDAAVYCPAKVARASAFLVQVFLYSPGAERAVAERAIGADPAASQRGSYSLPLELPLGTRVDLHLEAAALTIAEPDAVIVWRGTPTAAQFEVEVPATAAGPAVLARVRFAVAGVPAGTLRFQVALADATPPEQPSFRPAHAVKYRQAFVSYSSKDRAEVLRRVQAFKIAGMDVFQDILSLEPGERWSRELYREIDRCDVFLLFWSHAAASSQWVAKEIEYALGRKAGNEANPPDIQPVPIEGPPVVPPPPSLSHLHFNDALLAHIRAAGAGGGEG